MYIIFALYLISFFVYSSDARVTNHCSLYIYFQRILLYIVGWLHERQTSFYLSPPLWICNPCGRQSSTTCTSLCPSFYLFHLFGCDMRMYLSYYDHHLPSCIHGTTREIYNRLFNARWTVGCICIRLSCLSHETNRIRLYHHSSPKGIYNFIKISIIVTHMTVVWLSSLLKTLYK